MRFPLKEDTQTYKIYEMISKSSVAFFISEIKEKLGSDTKTTHALLTLLLNQKLITRSNFKLKTPKGGKTYIYGRGMNYIVISVKRMEDQYLQYFWIRWILQKLREMIN